jgi:broad specificity polyphosphatase/5'/3'-nucleotidase SurE
LRRRKKIQHSTSLCKGQKETVLAKIAGVNSISFQQQVTKREHGNQKLKYDTAMRKIKDIVERSLKNNRG